MDSEILDEPKENQCRYCKNEFKDCECVWRNTEQQYTV